MRTLPLPLPLPGDSLPEALRIADVPLRVDVDCPELRAEGDSAAVIRDVLARAAPAGWPSTVAVRVIRAALARPSTETISGRPPRRGPDTQTLS